MGKTKTDKLKQYIKDGRPSKLKSFTKKHRINLSGIKLKKQRSLLHYCSKHGNEIILRYLIDVGIDPFLPDSDGNLPLHVSLQRAIKTPDVNIVYTELILPQIEQFPQLLEVKNKDGTSCRSLLDKLVSAQQRNSDYHDQIGEDDSDEDWVHKLADELHYDNTEAWGHTEQDFLDDSYTQETYDDWADRINKEFNRKRQHSQRNDNSNKKYAKQETQISKDAETLEQAREEMRKKYEIHQKEARENILKRKRLQYEEKFKKLYSKEQIHEIGYDDIPWPFKEDIKEINLLLFCGVSISSNKEFYRKYLRQQQIRWHPDKFIQKLGHIIKDKDRGRILEKVKIISQELNRLSEEF